MTPNVGPPKRSSAGSERSPTGSNRSPTGSNRSPTGSDRSPTGLYSIGFQQVYEKSPTIV